MKSSVAELAKYNEDIEVGRSTDYPYEAAEVFFTSQHLLSLTMNFHWLWIQKS